MKKLVVMLFTVGLVGLSSCNLNRAKPVEEMESSETASANLGTSLARSALNGSQALPSPNGRASSKKTRKTIIIQAIE
jgi:hypothetical protein